MELTLKPTDIFVPQISSNPILDCCLCGPSTTYSLSASELGMRTSGSGGELGVLDAAGWCLPRLEKHGQASHQPAHPKGSPINAGLPDSSWPLSGMCLI